MSIDPGTIFNNGGFSVNGTLQINGTEQSPVTFNSGQITVSAGAELISNYTVFSSAGIQYYNNSILTINNGGNAQVRNSTFKNLLYWTGIENSGNLTIEDSSFGGSGVQSIYGIKSTNNATISNCNFKTAYYGLNLSGTALVDGSKIEGCSSYGIICQGGTITIKNSQIATNNGMGINLQGGQHTIISNRFFNNSCAINHNQSTILPYIRNNNFLGNQMAVKNNSSSTLDCTWNYWNHEKGPSTYNPVTKTWSILGDKIEGNIAYEPWFTSQRDGTIQPVKITVTGISEGQKTNQEPTINIKIDDGILVQVLLDESPWVQGQTISEGQHVLKVMAKNFEEEEREVIIHFSMDKTLPVAVIDNPAPIYGIPQTGIVFQASKSSDNSAISMYEWNFSDGIKYQSSTSTTNKTFSTIGNYTLTLTVKDDHGNLSEPVQAEIIIEDTPLITVTGVDSNGSYSTDLEINISVQNGSLTRTLLNNVDISGDSFAVTTEANHILQVFAKNQSGVETSKTIRFTLDKTPPIARIPLEMTAYINEEVTLNGGNSTDLSGIAEYIWKISGDSNTYQGSVVKKIFSSTGDYRVELRVKDNLGHWSTVPAIMQLHIVQRPVDVQFFGIGDGQKYNKPASIQVEVKFGSIKSIKLNGLNQSDTNFTIATDGDYMLEVVAINSNQEERLFKAQFSIDQTPPESVIDRSITIKGFNDNKPINFYAGRCTDNTGVVTYEWSFSDSDQKYFGREISRGFTQAREYVAILVVIDGYGNRSIPDYLRFNIQDKGNTVISITGVENGGKYNRSVNLQINVNDGILKRIILNDQQYSEISFTVSSDGIHNLRVEAENETGYLAIQAIQFKIDTTPPIAKLGSDRVISEGSELVLNGGGQDVNGISEYKWVFAGINEINTRETLKKQGLSIGEYSVSLWVKDSFGNWSIEPATIKVKVKAKPVELEINGVTPFMYTNQDVTINVAAKYGEITWITLNGYPYLPGTVISKEGRYELVICAFNESQEETKASLVFNIDKTAPVAKAGPDLKCFNDDAGVALNGRNSLDNLGVSKFLWTFPDGEKSSGPVVHKRFSQPGTYIVSLVVTDLAGNVSTVDTCQVIVADKGNTRINVMGIENGRKYNQDVFFRVNVTEGILQKITVNNEIYSDLDITLTSDGRYQILVQAINDNGYVLNERLQIYIDKTAPLADSGGDRKGFLNQVVKFNGGYSSDNNGIDEYRWEFSDGSTYYGRTIQRIFGTEGIYYVDLWVKDSFGNWTNQPSRAQIEILNPDTLSVFNVIVQDDAGKNINGAIVVIEDSQSKTIKLVTDYFGQVSEIIKPGTYKVYAYCPGYKSSVKDIVISEFSNQNIIFSLEPGSDIITVTESRQLDLNEIQALGIDTSLPENRFIFKFQFTVKYLDVINLDALLDGSGEIVFIDNGGGDIPPIDVTMKEEALIIIIKGTASVLKEFHELSVTLINGADPSVTLDETLLHLNLPNGLTLAPIPEENQTSSGDTIRQQALTVNAGTIPGQTQKRIIWVLRGDEPGNYNPTINYSGTLNPFGTKISDVTKLKDPINISDPKKLFLKAHAPDFIRKYTPFTIILELENRSNKPYYDAKLQVDEVWISDESKAIMLSKLEDLIIRKECLKPGEKISLSVEFFSYIEGVCILKDLEQIGGNVKFGTAVVPDCPHFFKVQTDDRQVMIEWFPQWEAFYHIIRRREFGENEFKVVCRENFGEWYVDGDVENFKTYEYTISTVNFEGEESIVMSDIITATPGKIVTNPGPGKYEQPIGITLDANTPGVIIYYTTDKTNPIPGKSTIYNGPILLDHNTIIKAVTVRDNVTSQVFEFGYLVGENVFGDFVDGDWRKIGPAGATRENLGDQYKITIPAEIICDKDVQEPTSYIRTMPNGSWSAETLVQLNGFTDGAKFAAGMIATSGTTIYNWGYSRGTNLVLTDGIDSFKKTITFGQTQVYLRIRKERNRLYFEYRTTKIENWKVAMTRDIIETSWETGVFSRTWAKTPLDVNFINYKVTANPELDPAWVWEQPIQGPDYHTTGTDSLTVTLPDDRTYSATNGPKLLRNIDEENWRFALSQKIVEFGIDNANYFSGIKIIYSNGTEVLFGKEGADIVVHKTGKQRIMVLSEVSDQNIRLSVVKDGIRLTFQYQLGNTHWTTLGSIDLAGDVVKLGVTAYTNSIQRLVVDFNQLEFEKAIDGFDEEWTWRTGTYGTSYRANSSDQSIIISTSDNTYFDNSDANHQASRLQRITGKSDWELSAKITPDSDKNLLAGLQIVFGTDDNLTWGLTGSVVQLKQNGASLYTVPLSGGAYLRIMKNGKQYCFAYRLATDDTWTELTTISESIQPTFIGLGVLTTYPTVTNTVYKEIQFTRTLPEGWQWKSPEKGPSYQVMETGEVKILMPNDKAYPYTTSSDVAPVLEKYPADLELTGDWIIQTTATISDLSENPKFHSGLMVTFDSQQRLQWGFKNGTALQGLWQYNSIRSITFAGKTVELRIRKSGNTYFLEYRISSQDSWTLATQQEITEVPQSVGWLCATTSASRVTTLIGIPQLNQIIPEINTTIKIRNAINGLNVSGAELQIDGKRPVTVFSEYSVKLLKGNHSIRVIAPGYITVDRLIDCQGNMEVVINLEPEQQAVNAEIVGATPIMDPINSLLLVDLYLKNLGVDVKLWVKMTLFGIDGSRMAVLEGEVTATTKETLHLKTGEWAFQLAGDPNQLKIEIFDGQNGQMITSLEIPVN